MCWFRGFLSHWCSSSQLQTVTFHESSEPASACLKFLVWLAFLYHVVIDNYSLFHNEFSWHPEIFNTSFVDPLKNRFIQFLVKRSFFSFFNTDSFASFLSRILYSFFNTTFLFLPLSYSFPINIELFFCGSRDNF